MKETLIVDDEADMCWVIKNILVENGCSCTCVGSGKAALSQVRKKHFELVFMDAKLPDANGLDVAKAALQINPALRIVLVSGYYYSDDLVICQAIEAGHIFHFIAKPFNHQDILDIISSETAD